MQTNGIKSFFSALFVVFSVSSQAQVYSVRVGSTVGGGKLVYQLDYDWTIGTPFNRFGLFQCRRSNGTSSDAPLIRHTTIHFASYEFTVQMPALAVAAIGVLALSSLALLAVTTQSKIRRHYRKEIHAA